MSLLTCVVVSDTHNMAAKVKLPAGDVLIHCGDATGSGTEKEVFKFSSWMAHQLDNFRYAIFVPGNHDFLFERHPGHAVGLMPERCHVLMDRAIEIDRFRFYGTPEQPEFCGWAFNKYEEQLKPIYAAIPTDVDVLITHSPPWSILDRCKDGRCVGSINLLEVVQQRAPQYHCFGHIHESYGVEKHGKTTYINAATCDVDYVPNNAPISFTLTAPLRGPDDAAG